MKRVVQPDSMTRLTTIMTAQDAKTEISEGPEEGVFIYGLFMQGARFDRDTLQMAEARPGELFDEQPMIQLRPVKLEDYKPSAYYRGPMYKTSLRAGTLSTTGHSTNFVVALDVPSDKSQDHWIRRGTAMLCMLDW